MVLVWGILAAAAVLAIFACYGLLRLLRGKGYLVSALAMIAVVAAFSLALLYLLPAVGYTPRVPRWTPAALLSTLGMVVCVVAAGYLARWYRQKQSLEAKSRKVLQDDAYLERP